MALSMNYFGDRERAKDFEGIAKMLLYKLENRKKLGNLNQIWDRHTFSDGTVIRMESIYDKQTVWITSPFEEKKVEAEELAAKQMAYIYTYVDGDNLNSPYPKYIWSSRNGKEVKESNSGFVPVTYTRRLGERTCLTENGLFIAECDSNWVLNIIRSDSYTEKANIIYTPIEFDSNTYIDIQADKNGGLWLLSCTNTWVDFDDTHLADTVLWYSGNNGKTFTQKLSVPDTTYAPVYLAVSDTKEGRVVYFTRFVGFDEFTVSKYYDRINSYSNVYNFTSFDVFQYNLDQPMTIAANGDTWVLAFGTENPVTGLDEPKIVRNGTIVWEGTPTTSQLVSGSQECLMVRNSGSTFVFSLSNYDMVNGTLSYYYSEDDGVTWTNVPVVSGGSVVSAPTSTIEIKNDDVFLVRTGNFDLSAKTTYEIYRGKVKKELELIYTTTFDTYITTSARGDMRILQIRR